uniref:Uncharacterized protein n=1 Tax=Sphaerodactylus townsendi TaxID=933632 RepID=A0ACB8FCL6_9SAUR
MEELWHLAGEPPAERRNPERPPKASSEDDSSGEEGREESELGPGEVRDLQWRIASMEGAHKRFEATLNELKEGLERMEAALNSLKCFCTERLGPMGEAVLGDQP